MYDPYRRQPPPNQPPQLFEDTSNQGYSQQNQGQYAYGGFNQFQDRPNYQNQNPYGYSTNIPGAQLMQDPLVANIAMQYGQNLVGQGRELVDDKLKKIVSASKMKYYFAVDTKYVLKKLQLLFFPFIHSDWSTKYNSESEEPVQPRFDINAPDLYIPTMAMVTYILITGLCLGLRKVFSPDVLGMQASWALVWLVLELGLTVILFHVLSIQSKMQTLHILALSAYKYVGMIASLIAGILLNTFGYYCALFYTGLASVVFTFRSYRHQVQGNPESMHGYSSGTKRRFYLLVLLSALQPFMMWLLTFQLCAVSSTGDT